MALDLEIVGAVSEVTELDRPPAYDKTIVKRLRDSHHALARALASGMKVADASLATGYSPSRISMLQADPAFAELLDHYRRTKAEAIIDVEARALGLGADAMQELHERLMDNPEAITDPVLLETITKMLGIAGYGPVSRSINKNFNYGIGDRLDRIEAKQRSDYQISSQGLKATSK